MRLRSKHALLLSFLLLGALGVTAVFLITKLGEGWLASGFGRKSSNHTLERALGRTDVDQALIAEIRRAMVKAVAVEDLPPTIRSSFLSTWDRSFRVVVTDESEIWFSRPTFEWWRLQGLTLHGSSQWNLAGELNREVDRAVLSVFEQ